MPRLLLTVLALAASLLVVPPAAAGSQHHRDDIATLEPALRTYLAGRDGHVTVAIEDLATGHRVVHHPALRQRTASIVKVEILMALLAQHHAPLLPERAAQARAMIENSNNDDAETLWERIGGGPGFEAFGRRIGLTHTQVERGTGPGYAWGLTRTTPRDQLNLLELIRYPNPILTDRDRHYIRRLMTHVEPDQAWGVSAGASSESVVALKNGWLELSYGNWQVNSIGRVQAPHHDYLIAVMTTGSPSMNYGIHTIQGVSRIVWRHLRVVRPSPAQDTVRSGQLG